MPSTHDSSSNISASEGGSSTLVRINKALAQAGVCSRRAADDLIAQGLVAVNGETVTSAGAKVDPALDEITVQGQAVSLSAPGQGHFRYVVINKPTQVVTTVSDPQGRRTVMDVLPARLKRDRLFPVGRLDFFSQGLLLLTNDGELANRLTHPRWHLPKVYHVTIRGEVPEAKMETMRQGMVLAEGESLAPMGVEIVNRQAGTVKLGITLIQGLNRQIRRMCRDLGLTVLRLERVAQGPITLGELREGQVRVLTPAEVNALRTSVDLEPEERQASRGDGRPDKG